MSRDRLAEIDPVSVKEYYYESYFRDADHLAGYLQRESMLSGWPMPPLPYENERDRATLNLYARYNRTDQGIRLLNHRKIYLFQRTPVQHYPAAPALEPRYVP